MCKCERLGREVLASRERGLTGNGELSLTLQERSVGVDELVRLYPGNTIELAIIPSSEVFRLPHACSKRCVLCLVCRATSQLIPMPDADADGDAPPF